MKPQTDKTTILPPLIFPGKTATERKAVEKLKKEGRIRPVGSKIYASIPESQVEEVVRASWAHIVGKLFPEALISFSTAFRNLPSSDGTVFLTSTTNRVVELPGLTLKFVRGHAPLDSDPEFLGARISSVPRALLENLSIIKRAPVGKLVSQEKIEKRLEAILQAKDEKGLNDIREQAREIAIQLGMQKELQRLEGIIGALLGTKTDDSLKSKVAIARSIGLPFDPSCFERLELLFASLKNNPLREINEKVKNADHTINKCFFESYFSNYIEGTRFEIEEAISIVYGKQVPEERPVDAHDILGTFKLISDPNEMRTTPNNPKELENILKQRHSRLFEKRPDVMPGIYKEKVNRAGNTVFVHPKLVEGTLEKGFELYKSLSPGLERAIFIQFLISDVHMFNDGNGRISRIMMNAELVKEGLSTIIIPNVYREDYITNLKSLSRRNVPANYVRMLYVAHKFSNLDFTNFPEVLKYLEGHNWFQESSNASIILSPK